MVQESWMKRPMFVVLMSPSVTNPCFGATPLLRTE